MLVIPCRAFRPSGVEGRQCTKLSVRSRCYNFPKAHPLWNLQSPVRSAVLLELGIMNHTFLPSTFSRSH